MVIIFLGPPGSGKGTQAAIISKILSIPSLSTSGILNDVIKNGGEFANELKNYMSSGKLVSSTLVNEIVSTTLIKEEYRLGCILDGYPRTLDQAEFLDIRFPQIKPIAIHCEIAYEVLVNRIRGRFACIACGAIYNKLSSLPRVEGVCDSCQGTMFKVRDDDNVEVLNKRWEVYIEETRPLLEYYSKKGCLVNIEATKSKEEITNNIIKLLQLSI